MQTALFTHNWLDWLNLLTDSTDSTDFAPVAQKDRAAVS